MYQNNIVQLNVWSHRMNFKYEHSVGPDKPVIPLEHTYLFLECLSFAFKSGFNLTILV